LYSGNSWLGALLRDCRDECRQRHVPDVAASVPPGDSALKNTHLYVFSGLKIFVFAFFSDWKRVLIFVELTYQNVVGKGLVVSSPKEIHNIAD